MTITMRVPSDPKDAHHEPWDSDPNAWKGEPAEKAQAAHETPEEAIERLIGEVAHV